MVCVATRNGNDGENAPREAMMGAAHAVAIIIGRLPRRSAMATIGRQITMPQRTIAAPIPWPELPMSNSSAA